MGRPLAQADTSAGAMPSTPRHRGSEGVSGNTATFRIGDGRVIVEIQGRGERGEDGGKGGRKGPKGGEEGSKEQAKGSKGGRKSISSKGGMLFSSLQTSSRGDGEEASPTASSPWHSFHGAPASGTVSGEQATGKVGEACAVPSVTSSVEVTWTDPEKRRSSRLSQSTSDETEGGPHRPPKVPPDGRHAEHHRGGNDNNEYAPEYSRQVRRPGVYTGEGLRRHKRCSSDSTGVQGAWGTPEDDSEDDDREDPWESAHLEDGEEEDTLVWSYDGNGTNSNGENISSSNSNSTGTFALFTGSASASPPSGSDGHWPSEHDVTARKLQGKITSAVAALTHSTSGVRGGGEDQKKTKPRGKSDKPAAKEKEKDKNVLWSMAAEQLALSSPTAVYAKEKTREREKGRGLKAKERSGKGEKLDSAADAAESRTGKGGKVRSGKGEKLEAAADSAALAVGTPGSGPASSSRDPKDPAGKEEGTTRRPRGRSRKFNTLSMDLNALLKESQLDPAFLDELRHMPAPVTILDERRQGLGFGTPADGTGTPDAGVTVRAQCGGWGAVEVTVLDPKRSSLMLGASSPAGPAGPGGSLDSDSTVANEEELVEETATGKAPPSSSGVSPAIPRTLSDEGKGEVVSGQGRTVDAGSRLWEARRRRVQAEGATESPAEGQRQEQDSEDELRIASLTPRAVAQDRAVLLRLQRGLGESPGYTAGGLQSQGSLPSPASRDGPSLTAHAGDSVNSSVAEGSEQDPRTQRLLGQGQEALQSQGSLPLAGRSGGNLPSGTIPSTVPSALGVEAPAVARPSRFSNSGVAASRAAYPPEFTAPVGGRGSQGSSPGSLSPCVSPPADGGSLPPFVQRQPGQTSTTQSPPDWARKASTDSSVQEQQLAKLMSADLWAVGTHSGGAHSDGPGNMSFTTHSHCAGLDAFDECLRKSDSSKAVLFPRRSPIGTPSYPSPPPPPSSSEGVGAGPLQGPGSAPSSPPKPGVPGAHPDVAQSPSSAPSSPRVHVPRRSRFQAQSGSASASRGKLSPLGRAASGLEGAYGASKEDVGFSSALVAKARPSPLGMQPAVSDPPWAPRGRGLERSRGTAQAGASGEGGDSSVSELSTQRQARRCSIDGALGALGFPAGDIVFSETEDSDGDSGTEGSFHGSFKAKGARRAVGAIGYVPLLGLEERNVEELYSMGDVLGEGQFGVTRLVQHKESGKKFACKTIAKSSFKCKSDEEDVRLEHSILEMLKDQAHVARIEETFETKESIHFVLELCNGGDLFERLRERVRYSEKKAATVMRTVLEVLKHCHERHIVHRDIKPENILLVSKESDTDIKVIDFGIAAIHKPGTRPLRELMGSPFYIAPEVIDGTYSCQADVWSAGVMLYVLLIGSPPFSAKTQAGILRAVRDGRYKYPRNVALSERAKDLIKKMLTRDPARRISPAESLMHPWLTQFAQKL